MKRRTKRILVVLALALSVVFSTCLIFAYESVQNVTIDDVTIRFKNYISSDMTSSYAETHGSTPAPQTYVNATFYYFDEETEAFGTIYLYQGVDGASKVQVNQNSIEPTHTKVYYKVVSNHIASYHGVTSNYPTMTTNAP